jgi:hypothetical protein
LVTKTTAERLKEKATKTIKVIDETDEDKPEYEFVIQRLSTFELIESQDLDEDNEELAKELASKDVTEVDPNRVVRQLKSGVFPMMKRFMPVCTLTPKIVFDDDDLDPSDENIIHQRLLSRDVLFALFNEILKFSGLDKQSLEQIKKKQKAQSSKT